jgi:hypothetical protein
MDDDAVGAGKFGKHCRSHGIGISSPPRLAYRSDMVDVHGQPGQPVAPPRSDRDAKILSSITVNIQIFM